MSFDLSISRVVPAGADRLYAGWTRPDLLTRWFTPDPWRTVEAEVALRPGGIFRTVMVGPDGERNEGSGCVLEAVPDRRLVWTNLLGPGFEPLEIPEGGFGFTALIGLEPVEGGTRYSATVRHPTDAAKQQHEAMGFAEGWGAALDQLLEVIAGRR